MADQATCGQGLAAHSSLPTKLGELTAAVADVLELHTKALDLADENARQEQRAYLKLVEQHRQTAARLFATGDEMAEYRDLPTASHDPTVLSSPEAVEAFASLVRVEQELLALLQQRVEEDRAMLDEMGRVS
jgi:hypothetical protein